MNLIKSVSSNFQRVSSAVLNVPAFHIKRYHAHLDLILTFYVLFWINFESPQNFEEGVEGFINKGSSPGGILHT